MLGNVGKENVFYDILQRKNSFQGYKNKKFKKSKYWHFSKGLVNPWFWSKNGYFSNFFFLGNIGQENVFYDILQRKNSFLGYKNTKFEKSKYWHFFKGVNPWFWSKKGNFCELFFLGNIGEVNVFYDILQRKNFFLGYKNKKLKQSKSWHFYKRVNSWFFSKKSKNWHFSRGVNPWFWSKNGHFFNFFFRQYTQENVFYDILQRKNSFLGFKNKKLKKSKYWHFYNGVISWFLSKNDHYSNLFF